jgi:uncharacterized heparinase superfamily protein
MGEEDGVIVAGRRTAASTVCPAASAAFAASGNYIMRSGADYMMIRCARVNFGGVSCHNHNDALSFVLQAGGHDFIIDPGTFSYTSYSELRNAFRSTAAHNVLQVLGQEQNDFGKSVFDYAADRAKAKCLEWQSSEDADLFLGEHRGFRSGKDELICTRRIEFEKTLRQWIIEDSLRLAPERGSRKKSKEPKASLPPFEWRFHLHPDVTLVDQSEPARIILENRGVRLQLDVQMEEPTVRLEDGWVSNRYGSKQPASVLCIRSAVQGIDGGGFIWSCL